jgi:hypothetical protein
MDQTANNGGEKPEDEKKELSVQSVEDQIAEAIAKERAEVKAREEVEVEEIEEVEEEKIPLHNYLSNKRIKVIPVQAGARWSGLLANGEEKKKDAYMYNKVKRSYQVPFHTANKGGGLHKVLDNMIPRKTVQYPNEELTEQQFFEKLLGADLNPLLPKESNFWRTDKRSRVVMDKKGLVLDLADTMGMLRYKILKTNAKKIAPSPELQNSRGSYEFMLVDESVQVNKMADQADLKSKAYIRYAEVAQSTKTMEDFMKSTGKGLTSNPDPIWLKTQIFKMVEEDPRLFLSYANDDFYETRILIHDGVKCGALAKIKEDLYGLDNGHEIGNINDTITYLTQPENQPIVARIHTLKKMKDSTNGNS